MWFHVDGGFMWWFHVAVSWGGAHLSDRDGADAADGDQVTQVESAVGEQGEAGDGVGRIVLPHSSGVRWCDVM